MGELLGVGLTHYPNLSFPADSPAMTGALRFILADPDLPPDLRTPAGWDEGMRAEWADDEGLAAALRHREALLEGLGRVRDVIDAFAPDAIVVLGDDQYENFREDVIPAFTVLAYDDRVARPWHEDEVAHPAMLKANVWGEGPDTSVLVRGAPEIGRELATGLIRRDFDVAYAYQPLHHRSLPHAFLNTVLYLDYDRTGFNHPIVALALNCYGSAVIGRKGGVSHFADDPPLDPPGPNPSRCMALGRALAETILASDRRIVVAASSSWSHAFLCDKTWRLRPDTPADREMYDALVAGDYDAWRARDTAEIEESGHQELLNWFVLAGAMEATGADLRWSTFVETSIFNSNKVFAIYEPITGS